MAFSVEANGEGTAASFKLFGSSIAFFSHSQDSQLFINQGRSNSRKDVVASMEGICNKSPLCVLDRCKVSKAGVEYKEEESPKGATICINSNENREFLEEPKNLLLPCPRCKSLDTKFCYFNNYSVKQPRHFCKKCQRYWTAGGTQRNIPVGSGRRKSKHDSFSDSYPHPHLTDSLSVTSDALDSAQHSPVSPTSAMTARIETGCSSLSALCTPKPTFIPSNQKQAPFCQSLPANGRIEQSVAGQECSHGSSETYASNELRQSPPPPLINELARSSFYGAPNFSLKSSQASKQSNMGEPFSSAGSMGRPRFNFLMGPQPNGYGLFGRNNNGGTISPSDLSSPFRDNGYPMGAVLAMASASSSYEVDNPALGKHPREGLPTALGKRRVLDTEEAAQSSIRFSLGLDDKMLK